MKNEKEWDALEQGDLERRKLAKEIEDYKSSKKMANIYWGAVVFIPLMFIGFNTISYSAIAILIVLSFHMRTRRIAYLLLTVSIPIYAFFVGGWIGLLVGLVPGFIVATLCAANYMHHQESQRLEQV